MGVAELETIVRLGLAMVVIVYDDEAYGAEVHHFGPDGDPLDTVRFPPADIAAIGWRRPSAATDPFKKADRASGHLWKVPGRAPGLRCGRTQRRPRSEANYTSSAVPAFSGSRAVGEASSAIEEPTLTMSSDG
jgi:hypothetical protein